MTDYVSPKCMVDVVLLTVDGGELRVLLIERVTPGEPFFGEWGLPGGFIHVAGGLGTDEDEDAAATARRVLRGKVGIEVPYLEQLHTFSGRKRDSRGWSLSVAYFAVVPSSALAGRHERLTLLSPVRAQTGGLPFDHDEILSLAVDRVRGKASYSSLPLFLLPPEFTLTQMQSVYEAVLGVSDMNQSSFRRKVMDQGLVVPISGRTVAGAGRPAQLHRMSDAALKEFSGVTLLARPIRSKGGGGAG